jgi:hypothetical protein
VKDSAGVAESLTPTPYGTFKFVMDPDGCRSGFVRARER